MSAICSLFSKPNNISHLSLRNCSITTNGLSMIRKQMEMCINCSTLTHIDLAFNPALSLLASLWPLNNIVIYAVVDLGNHDEVKESSTQPEVQEHVISGSAKNLDPQQARSDVLEELDKLRSLLMINYQEGKKERAQ